MTIHKKLLVIAPFPIKEPRHGGQKRTQALVKYYKSIVSDVAFIAIFSKTAYPVYEETDICLGQKEVLDEIDAHPQRFDLLIGEAPDIDIHTRSYLAKALREYTPDIIHIEQPYLYKGLRVLLDELTMDPIIIFGSENAEAKLKSDILTSDVIEKTEALSIVESTTKVETDFTQEADLVVAVSAEDLDYHKALGSKTGVVASNGIAALKAPTTTALSKWKSFKKKNTTESIVSFIGSSHPPNYTGYLKNVGDNSSFMPTRSKIVIAGGVSEYFKTNMPSEENEAFWHKVYAAGFLSEDDLSALIVLSEIILLPISSGGGSNLKTAEAIISGKKVVATSFAFRGYERYITLPNIYIADSPKDFKKAIITALETPYISRSESDVKRANEIEWQQCLRPIEFALKKVILRKKIHTLKKRTKKTIRKIIN